MTQSLVNSDRLRLFVRYLVLTLIAAIFIFPLVFMVMSSLKPSQQLLIDSGSLRAFFPLGTSVWTTISPRFSARPLGCLLQTLS